MLTLRGVKFFSLIQYLRENEFIRFSILSNLFYYIQYIPFIFFFFMQYSTTYLNLTVFLHCFTTVLLVIYIIHLSTFVMKYHAYVVQSFLPILMEITKHNDQIFINNMSLFLYKCAT